MVVNRSAPRAMVAPILVYEDVAKAIDWLCGNPPADTSFGKRQYTVEDPGGHRWTFSQSIADVAPEDWGATPARPGVASPGGGLET
jgi:hypothetical protein